MTLASVPFSSYTSSKSNYVDVAISFLARDEPLALDLRDRLRETLDVFVYSKEQEQLAGTDGLETLRDAFRTQARLVVVLYREPWGQTPWTRVEQTAVTDRALADGWDCLLFVTLDRTSALPPWLPNTRIRFSFPDYGIDEATGAIKARVEQLGGALHPTDAVARARIAADRLTRRSEIEERLRSEGFRAIEVEAETLLRELARLLEAISAQAPALAVRFNTDDFTCAMTTPHAGARIHVYTTNPIRESRVVERAHIGAIFLLNEHGSYDIEPYEHEHVEYFFDFRPGVGWCWADGDREFGSPKLADHIVSRFIALAEGTARGDIRHPNE